MAQEVKECHPPGNRATEKKQKQIVFAKTLTTDAHQFAGAFLGLYGLPKSEDPELEIIKMLTNTLAKEVQATN